MAGRDNMLRIMRCLHYFRPPVHSPYIGGDIGTFLEQMLLLRFRNRRVSHPVRYSHLQSRAIVAPLGHRPTNRSNKGNPQMVKRLNLGNNLGNELYLDLLELGKLDQWAKPFRQAYTMILSTGINYHNGHFQHAQRPRFALCMWVSSQVL